MSYHHLNRFTAHAEATLTPAERLLAWHFSKEIRARENYYSESLRRLSIELDLDRRTLQKALASLVDLGLFERIDRTGTYAPIYRLLVACPENCFDLDQHNTKQELAALKTLGGTNTPPLSDINTAPYIEKREEEDFSTSGTLQVMVLGLIGQVLDHLKDKKEDHFTLQGFLERRPNQIAKAALEILATKESLDTWKRQEGYLKQVILKTPENLLKYAEDIELILRGELALSANKDLVSTPEEALNLVAGHTGARLEDFRAATLLGFITQENSPLVKAMSGAIPGGDSEQFTHRLITNGVLDRIERREYFELYSHTYLRHLAKVCPEKLSEKIIQSLFLTEQVMVSLYEDLGAEPNFFFIPSAENPLKVDLSFTPFGRLPECDLLFTSEETEKQTRRKEALEGHKKKWRLEKNILSEHLPAQFWSDPETQNLLRRYPEPLTQQEKEARISGLLASRLPFLNESLEKDFQVEETEFTYLDFLKDNFTWEDDLNHFLKLYPSRPEGDQNYRATAKAFIQVRNFISQEELEARAFYYATNLGDTYAVSPSKWLENLLAKERGLGVSN